MLTYAAFVCTFALYMSCLYAENKLCLLIDNEKL